MASESRHFELLDGGKCRAPIQMLVLDLDMPIGQGPLCAGEVSSGFCPALKPAGAGSPPLAMGDPRCHLRGTACHGDTEHCDTWGGRDAGVAFPYVSAREAQACQEARKAGMELVVCTQACRGVAVEYLADQGVCARVVSCDGPRETQGQSAYLAAEVANMAYGLGIRPRAVAVVATNPVDWELFMGFGLGYSLSDAGAEACRAADARFPSRSEGGLVQAIRAVAHLAQNL